MTVITTIVSRHCIVHASDSFITQPRAGGELRLIQSQATKILPVRACRGSLAFYGLVGDMKSWTTLAVEPEAELRLLGFHRRNGFGIGIHFGAYERVDGYWIPEMFHITNRQARPTASCVQVV